MNSRERFVNVLTGKPVDRVPFMKVFGSTNHVLPGWEREHPGQNKEIDRTCQFEGRYRGWDTGWIDRVWVQPSAYLNERICQGMEIRIEAKMTEDFAGDDFCALFTKGSYATGFRILVRKDGHLLLQFAELNEGNPLWVLSRDPLPKNEWVTIVLAYRPPLADQPGEATIHFGDTEQARAPIPVAMRPSTAVIGIGCEFKPDPRQGPTGKLRPNFPGLVGSLAIKAVSAR